MLSDTWSTASKRQHNDGPPGVAAGPYPNDTTSWLVLTLGIHHREWWVVCRARAVVRRLDEVGAMVGSIPRKSVMLGRFKGQGRGYGEEMGRDITY